MSVPGSNILLTALRAITPQTVQWYQSVGRILNTIGQDVTQYAAPIPIKGSFQPVARSLYQVFGLDLQKEYFRLFAPENLVDISRNISSDLIGFQNIIYQCESATKWFGVDGWIEMLVIKTTLPAPYYSTPIFGFDGTEEPNNYVNFDEGTFSPESGP